MTEPDDIPPFRYTAALAGRIERAWQDRWEREGTFHAPNPVGSLRDGFEQVGDRPKRFVNDMLPYPSGDQLHVGHPLGFIASDVYGRYLRMNGHNVLHTMGFDAFGLPAEQFAIQTGQHPRVSTERNIRAFRRQLRRLGLAHDPRRGVVTSDASYYRWTQWIFLQIFNAWYDRDRGRARPVAELVAELDARVREPAEGSNPFGRSWDELTGLQRRQVVDNHRLASRPGDGAGQRGGHRRGPQRARQLPGVPPPPAAMDAADHRLRRPAAGRPGPARLAEWGQGDPAQLDRPLRGGAAAVRFARRGGRGVHHPARDRLRGDLPGARARASDGRRRDGPYMARGHAGALDRRRGVAAGRGRGVPAGGIPALGDGPAGRHERQDGDLHRLVRHQPPQRRVAAGLRRRLRAVGLRDGRGHGRARPGRA